MKTKSVQIRIDEFRMGEGATGPYLTIIHDGKKRNFFRNTIDKETKQAQAANFDEIAKGLAFGNTYEATVMESVTPKGTFENIIQMKLLERSPNLAPQPKAESMGPLPAHRYNLIDLLAASKIAATILKKDDGEIVTQDHVIEWAAVFVKKAREKSKEMMMDDTSKRSN